MNIIKNLTSSVLIRRGTLFTTITVFTLFSSVTAVHAAEWRIEPVVRVGADFNDNPFQSILTEQPSASGYIAEGSLNVGYASETSDFFVTPRVRSRSYGSNDNLDSDDQFLRVQYNRNTPLSNFRVRANYDRESVRTAERADTDFDIEDPDEIIADDSGRIDIRDRRERFQLAPSYTYRISGVSAISARVDFSDVRYAETLQAELTDYTDARLELGYRRNWTPRNTAIFAASIRNYQTDQGDNETNGIGFNFGFDREISQTTRFRATAGLEDTEVVDSDNEVNWVANVSLSRRLETTTLIAQYRRSISASGAGRLGARDSVNLNFTRELSERVSAGLGARVYRTNAIGDTTTGGVGFVGFDERSYVQLRSQFTWNVSQVFAIEANYRYTFLDRISLIESSNSNEVTVWFTYRPRAIVRAR